MEGYITTTEYAKKFGLARITVTQRCARGAIPGAIKVGAYPHQVWLIPADTEHVDGRIKTGKYIGAPRAKKKTTETTEEETDAE